MFILSIITLFYFLYHYTVNKDMNYIQLYYVNRIYLSVYINKQTFYLLCYLLSISVPEICTPYYSIPFVRPPHFHILLFC